MGVEDIGKAKGPLGEQAVQSQPPQQGYDDGYDYPPDPYIGKLSPNNFNAQMMNAVLDSKLTAETNFDDYQVMLPILIDNLARIPNINQATVRRLTRDFADIVSLSSCQGQRRAVNTRLQRMLFEVRALAACGETQLPGLTAISSIISTRQHVDQTVKMPVQPQQERKKLFGVF